MGECGHHNTYLVHPGLGLKEQHEGGCKSPEHKQRSSRPRGNGKIKAQLREEECNPMGVAVSFSASHVWKGW